MYVKLVVYTPLKHKEEILRKLFSLGAGKLGNYDSYSFVSEGITTYRALKGATPSLGKKSKMVKVREVRIETVCKEKDYKKIVQEIRKLHPYEEPAICVFQIKDLSID